MSADLGAATPTVTTSGGPSAGASRTVVGDGTTTRSRSRRRWALVRWPLGVVCLFLAVVLLSVLPQPTTSNVPLAPDNPRPAGAQALARVLEGQGVTIDYVRTTASAVARAQAGTTLLVTGDYLLSSEQIAAIDATQADLVLLGPSELLTALTPAATPSWWPGDPAAAALTARCADPDASAAGTISTTADGFQAMDPSATVCFPLSADQPGLGAYLVVDEARRITAIADPQILTNETITAEGNAALALRALGRHEHLTWYVPSVSDTGGQGASEASLTDLLPPIAPVLGLWALLVALVAGVWRARRLGPVVTEPLPVTVRAAETTRGRGRLYRRSRSYGHAAAALRAAATTRAAARVGLPRSAGAPEVIEALSRATGRPGDEIAALLYGPPPTNDIGLAQLARRLDHLESEVHRP